MPAKPTVSIDVDVEQHTVKAWHIVFMLREDPQAMPEMIYGDFFQQLTQDEYQWVDGKHVLVHAMTGERMRQLATYTLA